MHKQTSNKTKGQLLDGNLRIARRGMSLIELVVGMALLAIIGIAFVGLFLSSTKLVMQSSKLKQAELDIRQDAEGLVNGSGQKSCVSANLTFHGLSSLTIAGDWCTVQDEETGVAYDFFERD